jgi:hypothetical protein
MKGPLSNRATISIIAGAIIAGTIAMIMAVKEEKEGSPYEDILFQEKLRADTLDHNNMILEDRLIDLEQELDECLGLTYECVRLPPRLEDVDGTPPRTLKNETLVLGEIIVEDSWESEWKENEPPKILGSQDSLENYLKDPVKDGEVLPGPLND